MNAEQLKAELLKDGFVEFNDRLKDYENISLQRKIDGLGKFECKLNDKTYINVCISTISIKHEHLEDDNHVSVNVEVSGKNSDDLWFNLKCYGIDVEEFSKRKELVFNRLTKAWIASY